MSVSFARIAKGRPYSRNTLAAIWGYASYHAIARGVVTPQGDNKIILFVTEQKQESAEQYVDRLRGRILEWEGPTDHFAEGRMVNAARTGEEIHLFFRDRHHSDFIYLGRVAVIGHTLHASQPSQFKISHNL
jgi:hypothetical protein